MFGIDESLEDERTVVLVSIGCDIEIVEVASGNVVSDRLEDRSLTEEDSKVEDPCSDRDCKIDVLASEVVNVFKNVLANVLGLDNTLDGTEVRLFIRDCIVDEAWRFWVVRSCEVDDTSCPAEELTKGVV